MESLTRDQKGIADVLSIAFMFLFVVLAGTVLHAWALGPMASVSDRMQQQKCEHLYKTLELSYVENYSISYFDAIADNLVLAQPVEPGDYLRQRLDNALAYLCPLGYAGVVSVQCESEGTPWLQVYPTNAGLPSSEMKQVTFKGKLTLMAVENRFDLDAEVTIFER